jgi:hypothetical protein
MSGGSGPGAEQARRLFAWLETVNYKKVGLGLGCLWLLTAGAAAVKATSTDERQQLNQPARR